mmetsp:Transcript_1471/g.3088  ORF Transcript_1471/g.3088 Transcript_1471/m.3088 type:complete len:203 (-) Transcript_1471:3-611(-)
MNHDTQDSHLRSTSIVQFNSTLSILPLFWFGVPAEINKSITVVTREGPIAIGICHGNGEKQDGEQSKRESSANFTGETLHDKRLETKGSIFHTRQANAGSCGQPTGDGKHGATSMADLNFSQMVKVGRVFILEKIQGVEESQGSHGTKIGTAEFGIVQGNAGGSLGGRGECSRTGDEGGDDDGLHGVAVFVFSFYDDDDDEK